MILFPAIDLKDGQCVRLVRGDMEQATTFSENPSEQALHFEQQGVSWIHVVDLNGAFAGKPVNIRPVEAILETVSVPVQLGGGIRDMGMIETWLNLGVSRVILGTVALRNPDLVKEACRTFPGRVVVGIDAKGGKVAVEGWAEESEMEVEELALKFEDAGVAAIVYTNIERDGTLQGPDIESTKALAEKITTPVIASGGVSSMDDLHRLKAIEQFGVCGVIAGRSIYDGRIDIRHALTFME